MTPHQAADSTLPPDPASAPLTRKGSSSGHHKSAEGAIAYPSEDFIQFCAQRSRTENHKATKDIVQIGINVANAMQLGDDTRRAARLLQTLERDGLVVVDGEWCRLP